MKQLFFILLALFTLASCAPRQDTITSAAMDIYSQYTDHSETLTVAYIGDYENDGKTYNAVMFQTADSAEWEWLKQEFGIFSMDEVRAGKTQGTIMTSPGIGDQQPVSDDASPQGVMMGTLHIDTTRDFKDTAEFLAYIDSLTFELLRQTYGDSVARLRMRPVMVMDLDSMPEGMSEQKVGAQQEIDKFTRDHGSVSYLVNVDYSNQTLWLFFYDNGDKNVMKKQSCSSIPGKVVPAKPIMV